MNEYSDENGQAFLIEATLRIIEDGRLREQFKAIASKILRVGYTYNMFEGFSETDMEFVMRVALIITVERMSMNCDRATNIAEPPTPEKLLLFEKIRQLLEYPNPFRTRNGSIVMGMKVFASLQSPSPYRGDEGEVVGYVQSLNKFVVKFGEGRVDVFDESELLVMP